MSSPKEDVVESARPEGEAGDDGTEKTQQSAGFAEPHPGREAPTS